MRTRGEQFAGVSTAIVTPLKDGEVDYARLREQLEFQISAGVQCVCPVGTTGESPTLSHDEHERVIAETVQMVAGRIKVMPGTGSNSTVEALRLTKSAEKSGADGALVVAPYYNKPAQEGFYQHFKALAEQCGLPICVYNIPGRTGKNIEPETLIRLAELANIALVKEATANVDQASAVLGATDLTLLSGDDSFTLPLLALGGRGVISVASNVVPGDVLSMWRAFEAGDLAAARSWHYKMFRLCKDMLGLSTNPIPIKAAMQMLKRDTGELRLPMTELEAPLKAKLRQTLTEYGLL